LSEGIADILLLSSDIVSAWGYWVIFAALVAETTVIIGAFVPGVLVLLVAGHYIQVDQLSLPLVVTAAFFGTVVGDNVSFFLGRRYGEKLVTIPDRIRTVAASSPWIILVFHHTPATRLFFPAFMGMTKKLTFRTWISLDVASAILFVAFYLVLGYYSSKVFGSAEGFYSRYQVYVNGTVIAAILFWLMSLFHSLRK
jgi:membrane protein DedA with SNARE-associated domain